MKNELEVEKRLIDRETKIMLLKALKRGFFENEDIELLRSKYEDFRTVKIGFHDFAKIGYE